GMVKMPGALATIGVCTAVEETLFTVTTIGTDAEAWPLARTPNGTCALTYGYAPPGVTDTIGAGMLLNVTLTPAAAPGSEHVVNCAGDAASADVKIATSEPGATAVPFPFASLA